ncbi:MAG: hypothetical protein KA781_01375 [Aquabacterium sp.]|nr:hypothetical protein [Aquabacterium sp.]MBP8190345.1 hypothetical protein [Aquabacterium sp.]
MKHLVVLLLAIATNANADMVYRQGNDILRLTDKPCINAGVVKLLPEYLKPLMLQATAIINGKTYAPCWVTYKRDSVFLAYPDGDSGVISMRDFKNEPGI